MTTVRYIRNMRPNIFKIKLYAKTQNQIVYTLGRRGERIDTVAVPEEAFNDHGFLRNLRQNFIEEVSHDTFMALGTRLEDWPQGELVERVQHGVPSSFDPEVRVKLVDHEDENPTISPEEFRDTIQWRKPRLEFKNVSNSEADARRALIEAGELVEEKPKRKSRKAAPVGAGDPKKFENVNRRNTPRKGLIKGVVGGEEANVMAEDE